MLIFVFALTLIALGALHAPETVGAMHPKLREGVAKIRPYETYLGLAGVGLGIFMILSGFTFMRGLPMLIAVISGFVGLSLGLISGAQFLKDGVFHNNEAVKTKIDHAVASLSSQRQNLGIAGIALGVIALFSLIF